MKPPISTRWTDLSLRQAWLLVALGLLLELPLRYIIRPDMGDLQPGSPWFNLPLRIALEAGMVMVFLLSPRIIGASRESVGIPRRRWTRWEWVALAIVGGAELLVVGLVAGGRWPVLAEAGLLPEGLAWSVSEFLFGCNQETGFRGLIMTGLLRIGGFKRALLINTLLFLIGPLHGPGMLEWGLANPGAAAGYAAGVIFHGVAYSWIRYRSDNVILCAVLHGLINGPMNSAGLVMRAHGL